MKQITSIWRLTMRKILTALIGAASFLFGACPWSIWPAPAYGMPPDEPPPVLLDRISGTVIGDEGPVPGFWVRILNEQGSSPYTFTDRDGEFYFNVYKGSTYASESGCYTLFFQDVDGHLNGEYNSQTVQWCSGDGPLHIVLEAKE